MKDINTVFAELAQYTRLQEETAAIIDGLKDEIKEYMNAAGLEVLTGNEHKASYKTVTAARVDTTALKKDMPDIAAAYTRTTQSKRFIFQ